METAVTAPSDVRSDAFTHLCWYRTVHLLWFVRREEQNQDVNLLHHSDPVRSSSRHQQTILSRRFSSTGRDEARVCSCCCF